MMIIRAAIILLLCLFSATQAFAVDKQNTIINPLAAKACSVIKENIKKGVNIKKYVQVSIQVGHNPCFVVKCGIEGGGNLEQIIIGAVEGGATADVISRCAIDAGANVFDVARIIMEADSLIVSFFEPQEGLIPIGVGIPDVSGGGIPISPSSFGN